MVACVLCGCLRLCLRGLWVIEEEETEAVVRYWFTFGFKKASLLGPGLFNDWSVECRGRIRMEQSHRHISLSSLFSN